MSTALELERQSALLQAIRSGRGSHVQIDLERRTQGEQHVQAQLWRGPHHPQGAGQDQQELLWPYQGHQRVLAQQVLASAFPTIHAMLGRAPWPALAESLWLAHPPHAGDLNRWGAALPDFLSQQPELQAWPYLPDAARLDWACHDSAQAADADFEPDSLARLNDTDPDLLVLRLKPCVRLVSSDWPIVTLYQAHQNEASAQQPDPQALAQASQAIQAHQAQHAIVVRHDFQPSVSALPAAWVPWMRQLLDASNLPTKQAPSLGALLSKHEQTLDVTEWLTSALQQGWIWRLDVKSPSA